MDQIFYSISLNAVPMLFQACQGCSNPFTCDCTGIKGEPGESGINGLPGQEGPPGEMGPEGPTGIIGEKGRIGEIGEGGEKGYRVSFSSVSK